MGKLSILGMLLLSAASCAKPATLDRTFGPPRPLCTLTDRRITESSGVAPSYLDKDCYFTHNDSGDTARFFKFDSKGKVLATFNLKGVDAVDCEDFATANINGKPYVYLADIGDNKAVRKTVAIYRMPEPTGTGEVTLDRFDTFTITYPDKPHNAEAVVVNPVNGDIFIVTKTQEAAQVFKFAAPKGSAAITPVEIGKVSVPSITGVGKLITGGSCAPDARHILLRTYVEAYEFPVTATFDDWFKQKPVQVTTALEQQGEGICYSSDGNALVTTSEGFPCPVSIVQIKN